MRHALVIGGTGLIGGAVARHLIEAGWRVTATGRRPRPVPPGATLLLADHDHLPSGAYDLVVDCACYTAEHARRVLPLMRDAGSAVMISSKAVYVDARGNHVNSPEPPRFDGPVTEEQPTLPPGDMDYDSPEGYGPNKVAAEQLLLDSGAPVTVLRASKVHGPGADPARTWWFLKRALDRRPYVLLAGGGRGADHTSAAVNIAALVACVADNPGRRILNAADPDAPDGRAISRVIAGLAGHTWDEITVADDDETGWHPWHRIPPIVLDTTAAERLGYRPVGDFASTVTGEVGWLLRNRPDDPGGWFDYPAEDARVRAGSKLDV
ncbi:reductase [Actinoplanes philippinensis]|uniref:Nucleoside-diphosphate-sugar epimerase n=1 Tax=Actinoplanes philippinensis TaxID=35752 RepID=A0A1I2LW73_9ACTN|nr:NAD-dependent epimerase/dehydratase family protein [Actinoplanes philippinensis]GIE82253.1 reductase [Actinoplanes philippinensis]SFF82719.1 Nucleoside-diphosphate-sugar epimerase [Actinoplanes philippinensis]